MGQRLGATGTGALFDGTESTRELPKFGLLWSSPWNQKGLQSYYGFRFGPEEILPENLVLLEPLDERLHQGPSDLGLR